MTMEMITSFLIFAVTFIAILLEKKIAVHRAVSAMCGAGVMILAGTLMHFYDYRAAFAMVDIDTITLLFSMMLLMAVFEESGAFEFIAVKVARLSRGSGVRLMLYLSITVSILSMFLDNVTTVVLLAPVTLLITSLLGFSPIPFLLSEAILSNVSGAATLVGDPPNIMISSAVDGMTFMSFITHSLPVIAVVWVVTVSILYLIFRKELTQKPKGLKSLLKMNPENSLSNKKMAITLSILIGIIVALFFVAEHFHMRVSVISLIGAAIGMMISKADLEESLKKIDFSILIFFAALFVCVGGLQSSNLLAKLSTSVIGLAQSNMLLCCIAVIAISALASGLVDNIPFTIAMIPVIKSLGVELNDMSLVTPLWWALVFGVGLGGNLTHIGATTNIIVVSISDKTPSPITPSVWLKYATPVAFLSILTAMAVFALMYKHMSAPL